MDVEEEEGQADSVGWEVAEPAEDLLTVPHVVGEDPPDTVA